MINMINHELYLDVFIILILINFPFRIYIYSINLCQLYRYFHVLIIRLFRLILTVFY